MEKAVRGSSQIATAMVSYAEARATFARLLREESITHDEHEDIVEALNERWQTYEKPAVTESLLRLAGDFAQRYALRGYDSVQLASAFVCHAGHRNVRFLSFDDELNEAARQVMAVYQEAEVQDENRFRLWAEEVEEQMEAPEQEPKSLLQQLQPAGQRAFQSKHAQLPLFLFDTPITDEWDETSTLEKGVMLAQTLSWSPQESPDMKTLRYMWRSRAKIRFSCLARPLGRRGAG